MSKNVVKKKKKKPLLKDDTKRGLKVGALRLLEGVMKTLTAKERGDDLVQEAQFDVEDSAAEFFNTRKQVRKGRHSPSLPSEEDQ